MIKASSCIVGNVHNLGLDCSEKIKKKKSRWHAIKIGDIRIR